VEEVVSSGPDRIIVYEGAEEKLKQLGTGLLEKLGIGGPGWEQEERERYRLNMVPVENQLAAGLPAASEQRRIQPTTSRLVEPEAELDYIEVERRSQEPLRQRRYLDEEDERYDRAGYGGAGYEGEGYEGEGYENGGELLPLTIKKLPANAEVHGPRVISKDTALTLLQIMRSNVSCTCGSGKSANIPGLNVGGKTGTGDKWDAAARRYSTTKQVSSFAAVFPTDGPLEAPRYFVLILMDEPQRDKTGADPTGGIAAAPAAGRVIERIAPFLGVQRRAETSPFAVAGGDAGGGEEH
jgi:hypothetical protein